MELENNNNKLNVENTDTIDGLAYEQETSSLILLLADFFSCADDFMAVGSTMGKLYRC